MNILLIFDATNFTNHVTVNDNPSLVDYIIRNYGPALQHGLQYGSSSLIDFETFTRVHYDEAYVNALLGDAIDHYDGDAYELKQSMTRIINDDGEVDARARYNELVELCVTEFNTQVIAAIRGLSQQPSKYFTVEVLGYENNCLRILLKTDGGTEI